MSSFEERYGLEYLLRSDNMKIINNIISDIDDLTLVEVYRELVMDVKSSKQRFESYSRALSIVSEETNKRSKALKSERIEIVTY